MKLSYMHFTNVSLACYLGSGSLQGLCCPHVIATVLQLVCMQLKVFEVCAVVLVRLSDVDPDSAIRALKNDPAFNKAPAKGFSPESNSSGPSPAAGVPAKASDRKWVVPVLLFIPVAPMILFLTFCQPLLHETRA